MDKVTLIGKANAGKSSLFNYFLKKRIAIISDIKGTTRDIKKQEVALSDKKCHFFDTGGFDKSKNEIFAQVSVSAIEMAKDSSVVLFIVDANSNLDDEDKKIIFNLQKQGKKVALILNKIDDYKGDLWDFYSFGFNDKNIFEVSVLHKIGLKKLTSWVYEHINKEQIAKIKESEQKLKIAIIGRENVGKSSILNAICLKKISVVSSIRGTTIDPVNTSIFHKNNEFVFIDTAGLRQRGKIKDLAKYALTRTRDLLAQSNLALIVLDASTGFYDLDEKIASLVDQYGLSCIFVLNKWDKNYDNFEQCKKDVRDRFKFLYYANIIAFSALSTRGVTQLKNMILKTYKNYERRIPTSKLNDTIKKATIKHSLPSPNGANLKIYYASQFKTSPPTIALIMNKPKLLHFSYKRYLINFLRKEYDFIGTPILIQTKQRDNEHEDYELDIKYEKI
jgi:GTP-binding protein